jgi:hypothetical protein
MFLGRVGPDRKVLQLLGIVAAGIDRDEDDLQVLGLGAQLVAGGGQGLQGAGADVRAVGEAEEHRVPLTLQRRLGGRLAVLVDQLERPAHQDGGGAESKTPVLKISPPARSTANRPARIANNR